jgi:uncharacterized ubiquitin-like protein YukD
MFYYFTGLVESSASIELSRDYKGCSRNPVIDIYFKSTDVSLVKTIHTLIGHGYILYRPKKKNIILRISTTKGIKKVVNIINGRTKISVLKTHCLIDWLNKTHNSKIKKLALNNNSLYNDY